ncbi:hypothetical protein ACVXHB_18080 [Escherichia coli]
MTSPLTSPSQWGRSSCQLLHRRRWRRCRCGGHHAVTGAGIRCLRRRLCRTSGGQCEYPLGKFCPFLLFGTAPLMISQRAGILVRPTGAMVAKWCMHI